MFSIDYRNDRLKGLSLGNIVLKVILINKYEKALQYGI